MVELNIRHLISVLEAKLHPVQRRMVAGSFSLKRVADIYESAGYHVAVASGQEFDKEDFVDTAISSDMMQLLLRHEKEHLPPGTMVFVSGDGNENSGLTNFVTVLDFALNLGWTVIHWAWRACLSGRYRRFRSEHPHTYQQRSLDLVRARIVQTVRPVETGGLDVGAFEMVVPSAALNGQPGPPRHGPGKQSVGKKKRRFKKGKKAKKAKATG
jgi:hypothetical protein